MITLIATGHSEKGICNSAELLKVIEQIAPEVIFEETPPDKFDALYSNKLNDSLESKTIKLYLHKRAVDHFPVDMPVDRITKERVAHDYQLISRVVEQYCQEYRSLSEQHIDQAMQFGFPYLNSAQCQKLLERKLVLEGEWVVRLKHQELARRYNYWMWIINARENEMIKRIYNYSIDRKYKTGLFLVGVEHRKRIIEIIGEFERDSNIKLDWNFDYFQNGQ
jgi:hypothetical protein